MLKIFCLLFVRHFLKKIYFLGSLLLTGFGQDRPTGSEFRSTDLAWKNVLILLCSRPTGAVDRLIWQSSQVISADRCGRPFSLSELSGIFGRPDRSTGHRESSNYPLYFKPDLSFLSTSLRRFLFFLSLKTLASLSHSNPTQIQAPYSLIFAWSSLSGLIYVQTQGFLILGSWSLFLQGKNLIFLLDLAFHLIVLLVFVKIHPFLSLDQALIFLWPSLLFNLKFNHD